MTPEQRRQQFIIDIVEVCKRHRVMLEGIGSVASRFRRIEADGSFDVYLSDIYLPMRDTVWPIVQGEEP